MYQNNGSGKSSSPEGVTAKSVVESRGDLGEESLELGPVYVIVQVMSFLEHCNTGADLERVVTKVRTRLSHIVGCYTL